MRINIGFAVLFKVGLGQFELLFSFVLLFAEPVAGKQVIVTLSIA